jgi:hypothetical protein
VCEEAIVIKATKAAIAKKVFILVYDFTETECLGFETLAFYSEFRRVVVQNPLELCNRDKFNSLVVNLKHDKSTRRLNLTLQFQDKIQIEAPRSIFCVDDLC